MARRDRKMRLTWLEHNTSYREACSLPNGRVQTAFPLLISTTARPAPGVLRFPFSNVGLVSNSPCVELTSTTFVMPNPDEESSPLRIGQNAPICSSLLQSPLKTLGLRSVYCSGLLPCEALPSRAVSKHSYTC